MTFISRVGMVVALLGLALGQLSKLWVSLDIFSQLTLHWLMLFLACQAGRRLSRRNGVGTLALLVAMPVLLGLWARLPPNMHEPSAKAPPQLKLVSFNTWLENKSPDAVKAEIERLDGDVVTLIEFGPNKYYILEELKQRYPYSVDCAGQPNCSFAILSKYPLQRMGGEMLWKGPPYMIAELTGKFAGLKIIAVHTTRFPHSHAQATQLQALAEKLSKEPKPFVVMGDFNSTPFSAILQRFRDDAKLKRFTSKPSWPSTFGLPQLALDHIFGSGGVEVAQGERLGRSSGSDHYPVSVIVELQPPDSR